MCGESVFKKLLELILNSMLVWMLEDCYMFIENKFDVLVNELMFFGIVCVEVSGVF